jgi:outer membrane protein OmpA-like peptidoglycan-associated protein
MLGRVWGKALVVVALLAGTGVALAGDVLQGDAVTESALIDALAPPVMTRGLRPEGTGSAKPSTGQASLLIEFQTNSVGLTATAKEQLAIVGKALNTNRLMPFDFIVEGHADPRGNSDANQRLSAARAESVRQYLIRDQNVASVRLRAIGKGDKEPLNRENPSAPENRRVTIIRVVQTSQ